MRQCNLCPFQVDKDPVSDLEAMSDHLTIHNPSPAQWAEAYGQILQAKAKAKRSEGSANQGHR
jgi:hypothetical protein